MPDAYLVQLLLPVPSRGVGDDRRYATVRGELTGKFGGVTAYLRAPATGLWRDEDGAVDRDEVIMIEVVVDRLDREWWGAYRERLEARFAQKEIHLRAMPIERL